MAKKKGKGGAGDADAAAREAKQRSLWSKSFKALCAERKVSDDMRKLVESAFKPKEGDDGGVKKMIIAGKLSSVAVNTLCDVFKAVPYDALKALLILNCGTDDSDSQRIMEIISSLKLERFELRDCGAAVESAKLLGAHLLSGGHSQLKKIVLDFNPIGKDGAMYIAEGLKKNMFCTYLSLSYCNLEEKAGLYLGQMLAPLEDQKRPGQPEPDPELQKPLETLILSGNPLKCAGVGMFAQGLAKNRTLKTLDLENTQFGSNVMATQALAEACALCTSLKSVNIKGNLISDDGAKKLLEFLQPTNHIMDINLTEFISTELYVEIKDWAAGNKPKKGGKKKKKK